MSIEVMPFPKGKINIIEEKKEKQGQEKRDTREGLERSNCAENLQARETRHGD